MWDKRAKIIEVYDGDTLTAMLDQGFGQTTEITVRLLGVYAPELVQTGGIPTRDFVRAWVADHDHDGGRDWPFVVTTARGPRSDSEKVTLGRYLALVETLDHNYNLNAETQGFVIQSGYLGGVGGPEVARSISVSTTPTGGHSS